MALDEHKNQDPSMISSSSSSLSSSFLDKQNQLPVGLVVKRPARQRPASRTIVGSFVAVSFAILLGYCFVSPSSLSSFSNGRQSGTVQVLAACRVHFVAQLPGFSRFVSIRKRPRALAVSLLEHNECAPTIFGVSGSIHAAHEALEQCAKKEQQRKEGCAQSFHAANENTLSILTALESSQLNSTGHIERSCCVLALLETDHPHPLSRATLTYPGLRALPVWPAGQFRECNLLEQHFDIILEEFRAVRTQLKLHPERLVESNGGGGEWQVFTLLSGGVLHDDNAALAPRTTSIVQSLERARRMHFGLVYFSNLVPGTRLREHVGMANLRIRIHLGLEPVDGAYMMIAGQKLVWQRGRCIVIDDSFPHFVENNNSTHSRAILIVDIWHPDLSIDEINAIVKNSEPIRRIEKKR